MNTKSTENTDEVPKLQFADLSLTTALIVEDQPQILSLVADCLKVLKVGQLLMMSSAEMTNKVMSDIENNPTQVGISHVDFALVDWNLSGNPFQRSEEETENQGPDVCRSLRQFEFGRFMPILGMSAYSSKEIIKDMINGGVNGYLSKPFNIDELSRKIQRIVQDVKPYIVTPRGYFGPDRRRVAIKVEKDRRISQNGVRSFNPPRSLRQKTSGSVDINEGDVSKVMQKMREIAQPDYKDMVGFHLDQIKALLDKSPTDISNSESLLLAKYNFEEINFTCNEILGDPGGFTYQMIAEIMASMSRFVADRHFIPTKQAHSLIRQQIATVDVILQRDMKGPAKGEMRKLFSESFSVVDKMLNQNRKVRLGVSEK